MDFYTRAKANELVSKASRQKKFAAENNLFQQAAKAEAGLQRAIQLYTKFSSMKPSNSDNVAAVQSFGKSNVDMVVVGCLKKEIRRLQTRVGVARRALHKYLDTDRGVLGDVNRPAMLKRKKAKSKRAKK